MLRKVRGFGVCISAVRLMAMTCVIAYLSNREGIQQNATPLAGVVAALLHYLFVATCVTKRHGAIGASRWGARFESRRPAAKRSISDQR